MNTPQPPRLLGAGYRAVTLGIVTLVSLIAFESLAIATVMPSVALALDGMAWYALAFGAALAASVIGMVVAAGWNDRRGPQAPLWAGVACFVAGLLMAGLAPDMPLLLAGRLLQGLGDGLLSVSLYVLIGRIYPVPLRPRVFAAISAAWVLPSLIGPSISALILHGLGWRWVFLGVPLLAVPAALMLRPGLRALPPQAPDTQQGGGARRIAWAIGAAACACLLALAGRHPAAAAPLLIVALAISLALCARQLLPAGTLAAQAGIPAVIALRGLAAASFFTAEVFVPLMLARERGLAPLWVGGVLTAGALSYSAGSWCQGNMAGHADHSRRLRSGLVLIGVGTSIVALLLWPRVALVVGIAGWIIAGFGMGMVYPILATRLLQLSPSQQQGSNSAALQLANALSIAAMLALSGSLFAHLLPQSGALAFLATFVVSVLPAWLGATLAGRCFATQPARLALPAPLQPQAISRQAQG